MQMTTDQMMFAQLLDMGGAANYLMWLNSPQMKPEPLLRALAQMRKGGLTPERINELIEEIRGFRSVRMNGDRVRFVVELSKKYGLASIGEDDMLPVMRQVQKEAEAFAERCWHPKAPAECSMEKGKPKITRAHSIQNNRILNNISSSGHTTMFDRTTASFTGVPIGRHLASTFRGMCNGHDGIFRPIETDPFTGTDQQRFLFAYRSFLYSMHMKLQSSYTMDWGAHASKDERANRDLFDTALLAENWSHVQGDMIELPAFYPIAASGSFYLDFDFDGKPIPHSDARMEFIHVDLFPDDRRTVFLLSYLHEDRHLYEHLVPQLRKRNDLKSDLSVLLGGHTENIYFEPKYFETFIAEQGSAFEQLLMETQRDHVHIDGDGNWDITNLTPSSYLANEHNIRLFGY